MCEYDDKRDDCKDNILINAEIEDEAEAKQKQDDEDLFDLFILNEFFDLQGQGNNWNRDVASAFWCINYIEKLLLISEFRFLSSGMLQMFKYQRNKGIT